MAHNILERVGLFKTLPKVTKPLQKNILTFKKIAYNSSTFGPGGKLLDFKEKMCTAETILSQLQSCPSALDPLLLLMTSNR